MLEIDDDADGTAVRVQVSTFAYDHRDLVQSVTDLDWNADGIMDRRSTTTFTYDKHGNRLSAVSETQLIAEDGSDGDGSLDGFVPTRYAYEADQNTYRVVQAIDSDGDGTFDYIRTTTRTYPHPVPAR